jgi:hypothetical protein
LPEFRAVIFNYPAHLSIFFVTGQNFSACSFPPALPPPSPPLSIPLPTPSTLSSSLSPSSALVFVPCPPVHPSCL